MGSIAHRPRLKLLATLFVSLLLVSCGQLSAGRLYAAQLAPRSLTMSDALAAAHNVAYKLAIGIPSTSTVGSIRVQFCSNSALLDDVCTAPAGFDVSSATLASQTGATGFIFSTNSDANNIVLSRPPTSQSPVTATYAFVNVTNPTAGGTFYGRVFTYATSDGTGPSNDAGGLALAITPTLAASAEVPPYLTFCLGESITGVACNTATEPFSDFGTLAPSITSAAQSQLVVATNADNGFSMWASGTTMTSGNNTIAAMSGGTPQKGTPQFGINLTTNTAPAIGQNPTGPGISGVVLANYAQADHYRFTSGDPLVTSPLPDDLQKYTVSYIVNIPANQPGGVYSTTLTYVCLANF